MTVFFTHVFTGRYTLQEKSTEVSPKILNFSQIMVNKINVFTSGQSKNNKKIFCPVLIDLELT